MKEMQKTIFVYENWNSEHPNLMGKLFVDEIRGKESFAFSYDERWLSKRTDNIVLDPDLFYYQGRQYVPLNKSLFGLFSDSCPDRWGRTLLRRREALLAKKEERKPRNLSESDYLLGVYDKSRMGALRFSLEEGGPFLSCDEELSAPPWATLRDLENAAVMIDSNPNSAEEKWIHQLIAPGSSLGGARPKASVLSPDGSLWIAKFPSKNDESDVGAWEMTAHELAKKCQVNMAEAQTEVLSKTGTTFLTKRFDRIKGRRIHFASAMTLLGKTDKDEGGSYLDLVGFIKSNGAEPNEDLHELWRRIVFSILISNTDDHLRNHGFLLTRKGWKLSPAYDVNPVPYGRHLSLCVNENDDAISLDLAEETAKFYGISQTEAKDIIKEMKKTIQRNWQYCAKQVGLKKNEIDYMATAFYECL